MKAAFCLQCIVKTNRCLHCEAPLGGEQWSAKSRQVPASTRVRNA